jgi:hypothetical protein
VPPVVGRDLRILDQRRVGSGIKRAAAIISEQASVPLVTAALLHDVDHAAQRRRRIPLRNPLDFTCTSWMKSIGTFAAEWPS